MLLRFASHIPDSWHDAIRNAPHVHRWICGISTHFDVNEILIRDAVRFGTAIGFVFAEAQAMHNGQAVPRYAFLRGDSVGILVVLRRKNGPPLTLLTREPRLPVALTDQLSLPAGMVDDETVQSAALREFAEETGLNLDLKTDSLLPLTKVSLSPGGCDEAITLYALELTLPEDQITSLESRQTGLSAENEHIHLHMMKLDDLGTIENPDAKLLLAWQLYKTRYSG